MRNMEDIVTKYEDKIIKEMIDCYRCVLEYNGNIEYKIYIWEDGEIEILETLNGSRGWLQPKECETRKLYYITTVKSPGGEEKSWFSGASPTPLNRMTKKRKTNTRGLPGHRVSKIIGSQTHEGYPLQGDENSVIPGTRATLSGGKNGKEKRKQVQTGKGSA